MKLLRLWLRNICQHEELQQTFSTGLTGVFGPNGCGKSNMINAGIYPALTNDYGRVLGGRSGIVRQQAEPHEESFIELEAEHDGVVFTIRRDFQPASKHSLTSAGLPEPLTRVTEINQWLYDVLGLERHMIDNYLFVSQGELTALLSASPAVRAKSLARLCRTTHAEQCWVQLRQQIEADRPLATGCLDTTDEINARIGRHRAELKQLQEQIEEQRSFRLTAEELTAHRAAERDWATQLRARRDVKLRDSQCEAQFKVACQAVAAQKAAAATNDEAQSVAAELNTRQEQARSELNAIDTYRRQWQSAQTRLRALEAAELELSEFDASEPPAPEEGLEDQLRQQLGAARAEKKQAEGRLANLNSGADSCDKCGASLHTKGADARRAEYAEQIESNQSHIAAIQTELDQVVRDRQAVTAWKQSRSSARRNVDVCKAACRDVDAGMEEPEDATPLQEQLAKLAVEIPDVRRKAAETEKVLIAAREAATEAKSKHKLLKEQLATAQRELRGTSHATEDAAVTGEAARKSHVQAGARLDVLEPQLTTCETELAAAQQEMSRVQLALSRGELAQEWLQRLERMRDVVHRDQLPKLVHRQVLHQMEEQINDILDQFDNPFWVTTDEQLRFVAHFPSGTIIPGDGLSGGQQSVLAIAYRLTLNNMFAVDAGLLVLDEPTAWIDADNLSCLEQTLSKLNGIVKQRDQQIIIITHHEQLRRVFGSVIELGT